MKTIKDGHPKHPKSRISIQSRHAGLVRGHNGDIAVFRRETNDGKDISIKRFAEQSLPTLQEHLKQARQALESVSPKTTAQSKKKLT